jgi:hypothetical protein
MCVSWGGAGPPGPADHTDYPIGMALIRFCVRGFLPHPEILHLTGRMFGGSPLFMNFICLRLCGALHWGMIHG